MRLWTEIPGGAVPIGFVFGGERPRFDPMRDHTDSELLPWDIDAGIFHAAWSCETIERHLEGTS